MRYMHHANDSPYNNSAIGGLNLVSQSYNFVDRSHVGAVQLVSIVNDHIVNELRGQVAYRGQNNTTFSASGTGPVITVSGIANFGGPNSAGFVYEETTPEIADNFSYIRGSHSFKFGVSTHAIRDTQVQATFAQYNFPNDRGLSGGGERHRRRRAIRASARSWATPRSTTTRCSPISSRRIPGSRCAT